MNGSVIQDLRYAVRTLVKSPGFAVAAVLTLALGIGANTAIFSFVDAVLFRPLAVPDAERVQVLWETDQTTGADLLLVAPANFVDWRERAQAFDGVAAVEPYGFDYLGAGEPQNLTGGRVSEDFFRVMRVPPLLGRAFTAEDRAGSRPVAMINERMARLYFPGEDPVGKRIRLEFGHDGTREIIGVVGDVLHTGLTQEARPEVFLPMAQQYPFGSMTLVVHSDAPAGHVIADVKREIWRIAPTLAIHDATSVDGLVARSVRNERFLLALVGSFAALALTLAAAGIYGMLSFWTRARTREIGIRAALGARRGEILRLVVAEGVVLVACGMLIGLPATLGLGRFVEGVSHGVRPSDPATLATVVVIFAAVALAASWAPARTAARVDPMTALRQEG